MPAGVNAAVVDAVTATAALLVGAAPAVAVGRVQQQLSVALGLVVQDAALAQQRMQVLETVVVAQVCALVVKQGAGGSAP